jgi:hypothetical protein
MDPYLHTFLAVALMFVTYTVGRIMGTQKGITSTVSFLLHMGVCTEEDIQKANEKFEQDNF